MAQTLAALLGKPAPINAPDAGQHPLGDVVADATRLRQLGWDPRHSLRSGLEKLVAQSETKGRITDP